MANSRKHWVMKTDMGRYVRCPYSYWLICTGEKTFEVTLDDFGQQAVNGFVKVVDAYFKSCQYWMEIARGNVAEVASTGDSMLFVSSPFLRPRPKHMENEPEMGIWKLTAGGLDSLWAELAKWRPYAVTIS